MLSLCMVARGHVIYTSPDVRALLLSSWSVSKVTRRSCEWRPGKSVVCGQARVCFPE